MFAWPDKTMVLMFSECSQCLQKAQEGFEIRNLFVIFFSPW